MKLSGCGNCKRKSTCLIPDENKTWLQNDPAKETELVTIKGRLKPSLNPKEAI